MENLKSKKQNRFTILLFISYLLILTWVILFKLQFSIPIIDGGRSINLIPFLGSFDSKGALLFSEIRVNVLAFIPLGIYIGTLKASWSFGKKMIMIVGLTFIYEIIQFIFVIGRADITDVLTNTLGGIIGIGIYSMLFRFLKGRINRLINVLAGTFTILTIILFALLLASHRWVRIK